MSSTQAAFANFYTADNFAGFVIAIVVSWAFNWPIAYLLRNRLRRTIPADTSEAEKQMELERLLKAVEMPLAGSIGRLERVIYITAIMMQLPTVINGWITLKAFSAWLEKDEIRDYKLAHYYHYIFGTGLSLLLGIVAGNLGLTLAQWHIGSVIVQFSKSITCFSF